jgi:hypothetical protein
MTEKPDAPKPDDDTYSHEETVRRREATIRAMIAMKPKPRTRSAKPKTSRKQNSSATE